MGYLNDFIFYSSGNECPDEFLYWSGLSLLGATLGRNVWTRHGDYFLVFPNIYTCLVGTAGSGKSTAKGVSKNVFVRNFPARMISASIQSREDISDLMASDECVHTWKDATGAIQEYRPFYIIANELASFLSVDKGKMVEFLVDIYDENFFSTGFKGQRLATPGRKQWFENPYVSMLACATPKWFMSNLKFDLFEGGLGRRLIIVYGEKKKLISDPHTPAGGNEALGRAIQHLKSLEEMSGLGHEITRTPSANSFWKSWYMDPKRINRDDPILSQFHETKPIQVLKVASLLALSESPIRFIIDDAHLQGAIAILDALEPNVVRLTSGIGRNELAGVGSQILDFLQRQGGYAGEKQLLKFFSRYLRDPEFNEVMQHYQKTEQLFVAVLDSGDGVPRTMLMLPYFYKAFTERRTKGMSVADALRDLLQNPPSVIIT